MICKLKEHMFVSDADGALYDTRLEQWSGKPLRRDYRGHFGDITNAAKFKAALRAGQYSDVGGYPLYFILADGESLSFDGALLNFKSIVREFAIPLREQGDWRVVSCQINYEDTDLHCVATGKLIPSAYGETGVES